MVDFCQKTLADDEVFASEILLDIGFKQTGSIANLVFGDRAYERSKWRIEIRKRSGSCERYIIK